MEKTLQAQEILILQSLTADLARAQARFHRLNRYHFVTLDPRYAPAYRALKPATERRIVELALRIERLQRFASMLRVKELLTSGGRNARNSA